MSAVYVESRRSKQGLPVHRAFFCSLVDQMQDTNLLLWCSQDGRLAGEVVIDGGGSDMGVLPAREEQ